MVALLLVLLVLNRGLLVHLCVYQVFAAQCIVAAGTQPNYDEVLFLLVTCCAERMGSRRTKMKLQGYMNTQYGCFC